MGIRSLVSVLGVGGVLLGGLLVAGCEGDKPPGDAQASASAATATAKPGVDPRLASAVESAAAMQDAGAEDGPPANGVFAPGQADRAHPPTAGRKVELMDAGSEPRIMLRPTPQSTWPKSFALTIAQRVGPQAMPTLEYTVGIKSGGDAKATADEPSEGSQPAAAGKAPVTLVIKKVRLAKMQPGAVPADLEKQVAKLEGSRLDAELDPDGALSNVKASLAKGTDPGLAPVLGAFEDALDLMFVPAPDKPVGAGAYWMVVDRARPIGLDFVRYRVYRVKQVTSPAAEISVDVRQYSVGGAIDLGAGAPGGQLTASACESAGQGTAIVQQGQLAPSSLELALPIRLQLTSEQKPGQAMMLQAEFAARMSTGQPAEAKSAPPTSAP